MTRRRSARRVAPSTVRAIFDPAGDICVRPVTPRGNTYEIEPRVPFQIAAEDVEWFFHEWEAQHRQCLSRVEEYQPRKAQFENGKASRAARRVWPAPPSVVEPEPVVEPKENTEPDSVEAGADGNEDKE